MPKSIYKSTNSLQNVILLLLFVIGLFVLYRYVKTIETETKLLHNHVIELTEKIQNMSTCKYEAKDATMETYVRSNNLHVEGVQNKEEEEDTASIKSDDITNMLKKVMGGGNTYDGDVIVDEIVINVEQDEYHVTESMTIEDITNMETDNNVSDSNKNTVLNLDDTTSTHSQEEISQEKLFYRKTNEELKGMLKVKQLSTKGSKQELVERLMNNL